MIRVIPISKDDPDVFYCFSYVFLHFRMIARTSRTTRAAKKASTPRAADAIHQPPSRLCAKKYRQTPQGICR